MSCSFRRSILVAFGLALAATLVFAQTPDSLANLIQAGNRKAALDQIRAGADVNTAQPDGTRPIHWAVVRVEPELLAALIAKKAKVDVRNEFGSTPIAEAAKLGDARMVKMLLDAGAEPEGANPDGETALMLAIKTGQVPVVELLIKAGASVNTIEKFHHQTPLMWAADASKNPGEMVKLLLAKDANVGVRAQYSDWPSQITSEPRAQYRPVGGLTALLYAARSGCYSCAEALIGSGADVNTPTPEGLTPLMMALDNEHNDVAKLLLNHGANPHVWDWWGRTALYFAVDMKEGGGTVRGPDGSPIHVALRSNPASSMEIVNMLLAAGVDPNPELNMHRPSRGGNGGRFTDPLLGTGCTPLLRATMASDMEVIQALLAKGASPGIGAMGITPFLVAAGIGSSGRGAAGGSANLAVMDLLLQHGASVNEQVTGTKTYSLRIARSLSTSEGMTALHAAVQLGRADVVRFLLDKGANPELVDSNGHKAIELVGNGARGGGAPALPAATGAARTPPAGAGARGGAGADGAASAAEIRAMLDTAASKK